MRPNKPNRIVVLVTTWVRALRSIGSVARAQRSRTVSEFERRTSVPRASAHGRPVAKHRIRFLAFLILLAVATAGRATAETIEVDSTADAAPAVDGKCTLREAIENANDDAATNPDCAAGTGEDTIQFSVTGTITLYAPLPSVSDDDRLTIDGGTLGLVRISGDDLFQVFDVALVARLTLKSLTIERGSSTDQGGAIYNNGFLTIVDSTLSRNQAESNGGAIFNDLFVTIIGSTISNNHATHSGGVGGLGGGIYNNWSLEIVDSTVSSNTAYAHGGGIFNTELSFGWIAGSTLAANDAAFGNGGGVYNRGELLLTNSTLSGNGASLGAVPPTGWGGNLNLTGGASSNTTIVNSTLAGGYAGSGGGLYITGQATLAIANSILGASAFGEDCFGATGNITALGHNLDTDGTCGSSPGFATVSSSQLKLGPLFWNGGPTQTRALLADSVAINAGDQAQCEADEITTDQRGEPRDGSCDIGAYEFVAPPPPPQADLSVSNLATKTEKTGKSLTYTINATNNGPNAAANVVINDQLATGTGFVSLSAPGAVSCTTPPSLATGTVSCSYGSLASGSSIAPIKVVVKITAKGNTQLNNTATAASTTLDPNPGNNSATATTKVAK
jgi:uncharacterized repeat protein (TIGR01451 family)/CSLREA domain-containing protein